MPFTRKRIASHDYHAAKEILRLGDILLSRTYGEMANVFIPGNFTHAAICSNHGFIVEAIGRGVVESDLIDFMLTKDEVVVMRPRMCPELGPEAAEIAWSLVGAPYDYAFVGGNQAFYCSEAVWYAWDHAFYRRKAKWDFERRYRFGELTVVPQDFYNATMKLDCVYDSRK